MASLRNAIPQKNYRERAQPRSRAKYGILEKHKDYSARAKDYNAKKERLRILRQKAKDRNPDEFHFGMMSGKTEKGIKIADRGNRALSHSVVKLMKTQDAGYLRTLRNKATREREKLEEEIQILSSNEDELGDASEETHVVALKDGKSEEVNGRHTVFVNDDQAQKEFSPKQWFSTNMEGLGKSYNRPRMAETSEQPENLISAKHIERKESKLERMQREEEKYNKAKLGKMQQQRRTKLEALRIREQELIVAEQELELQRARMSNDVRGINKNGVKFKIKERKR